MTASSLVDRAATRSCYVAHGVELVCDFPLPIASPASGAGDVAATIVAEARPRASVEALWSGPGGEEVQKTIIADGRALTVERGRGGDHLVEHGEHLFHLSADLGTLSCTPPDGESAAWQRLLLDWVAYVVSTLAGMDAIHAGAVRLESGVVALAAASGAGKTTLVAELVCRGADFFCDDVVTLGMGEQGVLAYPGAPFVNLDRRRDQLAERLGTPLATFGDEVWLAPRRLATEPAPIAAIVMLDRREDGPEPARIVAEDFIALRRLAVGFPQQRGLEQRRFAVLTALASEAALLRLEASSAISSGALAGSIEAHLEHGGVG